MARAALQAGLVDRIGDRRAFKATARRSRRRLPVATAPASAIFELGVALRRRRRRQQAERADRRGDDCRHDRRRQGRPGECRRLDTIAKGDRGNGTSAGTGITRWWLVRVDSPGGSVLASDECIRQALLEAIGVQHPDRRVKMVSVTLLVGQPGFNPGRFHLRRAIYYHRLDRRVRRAAEAPGGRCRSWRRGRRWREDPRRCRESPSCCNGSRRKASQLIGGVSRQGSGASALSGRAATRAGEKSTGSREGACGMMMCVYFYAGRGASAGRATRRQGSEASGEECTEPAIKQQRPLSDEPIHRLADQNDDTTAAPADAFDEKWVWHLRISSAARSRAGERLDPGRTEGSRRSTALERPAVAPGAD